MDLSCIKTKRGGVVSIHMGKVVTTNLWDDFGWYEITNEEAIKGLKLVIAFELRSKPDEALKIIGKLKDDYPDPSAIGSPYRRTRAPESTARLVEREEPAKAEGAPRPSEETPTINRDKERELIERRSAVADRVIRFFSEFAFSPSIRFVNTLLRQPNLKQARAYTYNYFALCDHPDRDAVNEKIKSDEFAMLYRDGFPLISRKVNDRLEIYYGAQGTGKTTQAVNKYPDACVTVCNETMDSGDLMKTFAFNDENGRPQFKPSALQEDMIAGRPHILDEINLLPLSSLRYLQGILDGKEKIEFEGKTITIAPGFKIIGTMNLVVNGQTFSLPEPFVDRAAELIGFEITPAILSTCAF